MKSPSNSTPNEVSSKNFIPVKVLNMNFVKYFLVSVLILLLVAFLIAFVIYYQLYKDCSLSKKAKEPWMQQFTSESTMGIYPHVAISSDASHCSSIGKYMLLARKGHAVDAAIATLLCDSVMNIQSMGIGGGGFMLIYNKSTGRVEGLNFREKAPLAATKDMFVNKSSLYGVYSIAVPGELQGYYEAHIKYGRLPWSDLFQPTIGILESGVPISKTLDRFLPYIKNAEISDGLKKIFYNSTSGKWLKEGDFYQNKKLAETFKKIAKDPRAMYGHMAKDIVKELSGSLITDQDLKNYTADWVQPVVSPLDGNKYMYSMPPPSSGALAIYMINILRAFSPKLYQSLQEATLFFHRFVEAMKFAYSMRSNLGDPKFLNATDIAQKVKKLTSIHYAFHTKSLINDGKTHPPEYYTSSYGPINDDGTAHINVVDEYGNAVSVTSSINILFGSRIMGNITGILYNNQMDDFSQPHLSKNVYNLASSKLNYVAPGKRPMSSMSPLLIIDKKDGSVFLANGASGGSRITSGVAYTSIRALFFNETIKQAIDYPRLHHQLFPNCIYHEEHFPKDILDQLKKIGHSFCPGWIPKSTVQALLRFDNKISANSDYRKGGTVDGF